MHVIPARTLRLPRFIRELKADLGGIAAVEFALALPAVMGFGMYGIEVANLAQTHLRVSQAALALADNASRVGIMTNLNVQQLREVDINDIIEGVRAQAKNLNLGVNGRITLSSLETNSSGGQWIHWQRCLGLKRGPGWDSSYKKEGEGITGTSFAGMGPAGKEVKAPPGAAVMFVEINYQYQPIIGAWLIGSPRITYTASYVVRDKRDLDQTYPYNGAKNGGVATGGVYNPSPQVTPMTCDKYTT
ncbi:histidine kinase [Sphingomonas sp.]|jgi:hypothetical protein|uniref:TadE/TadG family type IV pilus assembly protein n=1 Tax=Sphingomonas sp. TaxID=28214 RepID=UPI002DB8C3B6|nr:histidine kinase [Sphingomonas sp.]HEU4969582.1 histidine kinase [Sphingomonas sp.]